MRNVKIDSSIILAVGYMLAIGGGLGFFDASSWTQRGLFVLLFLAGACLVGWVIECEE